MHRGWTRWASTLSLSAVSCWSRGSGRVPRRMERGNRSRTSTKAWSAAGHRGSPKVGAPFMTILMLRHALLVPVLLGSCVASTAADLPGQQGPQQRCCRAAHCSSAPVVRPSCSRTATASGRLNCIAARACWPAGQQPVVWPGARVLIVAGAPAMQPLCPQVSTAWGVRNRGE